jgi:hypothetical protein
MRWRAKSVKKSVVEELADAISRFELSKVSDLLADDGHFSVQNSVYEISVSGRNEFVSWIADCHKRTDSRSLFRRKLCFSVVRSMHSISDSTIILFNDGKFPVLSAEQGKMKSGLVVTTAGDKVCRIDLCFLIMKTESPFIYERRMLGEIKI